MPSFIRLPAVRQEKFILKYTFAIQYDTELPINKHACIILQ